MNKEFNVPRILEPVITEWKKQGNSFYLGPENLFFYKGKKIKIFFSYGIPETSGSWYCRNNFEESDRIPELTVSEIEDIAKCLVKSYNPNRWGIIVDYRCNYSCGMCPFHGEGYSDSNTKNYWNDRMSQKRAIPLGEIKNQIDKVYEYGIRHINMVSNGEIILYSHWKEAAKYASEKGFTLGTITNGALVDNKLCEELKSVGFSQIRISLDALSYNIYSKIRSSSEEYYRNAINAPILLKEYGFDVNVHFVEQEDNMSEKDEFVEYWKTKNVNSISVAKKLDYHDTHVRTEQPKDQDDFIPGTCMKYGNFISLTNGIIVPCCGTQTIFSDGDSCGLPVSNINTDDLNCSIKNMNDLMAFEGPSLYQICKKCALYCNTEEIYDHGEWILIRTSERETWINKNK